jgi:hypothetical protein
MGKRILHMRRRIMMLIATAILALTMAAGTAFPAFALSPSEQACLDAGGTPDRVQGTVSCILVEEGKNPKFTDTVTTSGQGNIGNKTQSSDVCDGTGSGKCPPGQF